MYNETMLSLVNAGGGGNYWMGYHYGPLMWVFPILLIVGVVIIISRLTGGARHVVGNTALDVLAQRFANGEIDEAEYLEKRNVLKSRH